MIRPLRRALAAAVSVGALGAAVVAATPSTAGAAPTGCATPSLNTQIKQADVVFRGVVDRVRPVTGRGTHRIRTYKVTADRVYRSSLVADSVTVTAKVGAACPPPTLVRGKRYIFFVTESGSRLVSTPFTARATASLTHRVVARLGSGEQPHPPPPAHAQFTKVADAEAPALSRLLAPGAALLLVSLLGLVLVGRLGRRPTR